MHVVALHHLRHLPLLVCYLVLCTPCTIHGEHSARDSYHDKSKTGTYSSATINLDLAPETLIDVLAHARNWSRGGICDRDQPQTKPADADKVSKPVVPSHVIISQSRNTVVVDSETGVAFMNVTATVTITGNDTDWVHVDLFPDSRTVITRHNVTAKRVLPRPSTDPSTSNTPTMSVENECNEFYFGSMPPLYERVLLAREGCEYEARFEIVLPVVTTLEGKYRRNHLYMPLIRQGPSTDVTLAIPATHHETLNISRQSTQIRIDTGAYDDDDGVQSRRGTDALRRNIVTQGSFITKIDTNSHANWTYVSLSSIDTSVSLEWSTLTQRALGDLVGRTHGSTTTTTTTTTSTGGGGGQGIPRPTRDHKQDNAARPPRTSIHSSQSVVTTLSRNHMSTSTRFVYRIVKGETEHIDIQVPRSLRVTDVSGNLESWTMHAVAPGTAESVAGKNHTTMGKNNDTAAQGDHSHSGDSVIRVTLNPRDDVTSALTIFVSTEAREPTMITGDTVAVFDLPILRTANVDREKGQYAVYRESNLNVRMHADRIRGVNKVDLDQGDSFVREPASKGYSVAATYTFSDPRLVQLRVDAVRHNDLPVVSCIISSATLDVTPTKTGTVSELSLEVQNMDQSYLELAVPPNHTVWSAHRDHEAVSITSPGEGRVHLPLRTRNDGTGRAGSTGRSEVKQLFTIIMFSPSSTMHVTARDVEIAIEQVTRLVLERVARISDSKASYARKDLALTHGTNMSTVTLPNIKLDAPILKLDTTVWMPHTNLISFIGEARLPTPTGLTWCKSEETHARKVAREVRHSQAEKRRQYIENTRASKDVDKRTNTNINNNKGGTAGSARRSASYTSSSTAATGTPMASTNGSLSVHFSMPDPAGLRPLCSTEAVLEPPSVLTTQLPFYIRVPRLSCRAPVPETPGYEASWWPSTLLSPTRFHRSPWYTEPVRGEPGWCERVDMLDVEGLVDMGALEEALLELARLSGPRA